MASFQSNFDSSPPASPASPAPASPASPAPASPASSDSLPSQGADFLIPSSSETSSSGNSRDLEPFDILFSAAVGSPLPIPSAEFAAQNSPSSSGMSSPPVPALPLAASVPLAESADQLFVTPSRQPRQIISVDDDNDNSASIEEDGSATLNPVKRLIFSTEISAWIMKMFLDFTREGRFNSSKRSYPLSAFEEICSAAKERWPRLPWTTKAVMNKYVTEKKRFRLWEAFASYSGVTYNDETGLLSTDSEERWEGFRTKYNNNRGIDWLRTTPLGHLPTYREVFFKETATGRTITSVDDVDLDSPLRNTSKKRQAKDLEDPDSNLTLPQRLAIDSSSAERERGGRGSKQQRKDQFVIATEKISQAISGAAVAYSARRPAGGEDTFIAVKDLYKRFANQLTKQELKVCMDALREAGNAIVWNAIEDDEELKRVYIDSWIAESR